MEMVAKECPMDSFMEPDIGSSSESFLRFLEAQKELFHSQIDQLRNIVATQCKLTGVNPLSQEMAAGALSIKIGKRPRDLLNPKGIQYMQSVFSIKDTISKKETREISALCGVTVTQVRDFFAGQRSRVRRLVRLSREKTIRFKPCEAPLDESKAGPNGNKASPNGNTAPDSSNAVNGIIINFSQATPVSNPVPLNTVDPRNAMEGTSCSPEDENIPGIDDSDKHFLQNILNLMRKETTFSGQAKLMEWILQIHNSAVLQWFLTKGGVMILATWLSLAALEEQTTVILIIFKVLCHLPLHKAFPAHMSAILQTVNRLRFYRTSDISNRARILLSRWSKLFVRSQAMKKPSSANCTNDTQKERIRKQRISEILSDESWQSKIDIPEDILALTNEESENSRKESKQALKMLTASGENSNKKLALSGSASQTRERRKVLLVEQPGSKTAGRSAQVARAATTSQSRPMSADDIQKAKMRAMFMQSKYEKPKTSLVENSPDKSGNGKPNASSNEVPQEGTNDQKTLSLIQSDDSQNTHSSQIVDNYGKPPLSSTSSNQKITSLPQSDDAPPVSDALQLKQGEDTRAIALPSETSDALLETSMDSKPSMVPQEPLWEKLKRDQVQWQTPPEVRMNELWSVGAGEKSKEVQVQTARIRREKETVYDSIHDIPLNPKEPWDVEMDFDDTLTLEIPTEQPPDTDGAEASSLRTSDNNAGQVPTVVASTPVANGNLEPDLELLAVLLKNPELVFALTSGQGNGFTSAETVALLDMLKRSNISLPGTSSGLEGKTVQKPEMTSLPSPTPLAERETGWGMEYAPASAPTFSQPTMPGTRFPTVVPTQAVSLVQHQIPSTNPAASAMPEKPPVTMLNHISPAMVATLQNAAPAPVQKLHHSVVPAAPPQVQSTTTPSQHFNVPESSMHPPTNYSHLARIPQQMAQPEILSFGLVQQQQQALPPRVSMLSNSLNERTSIPPPPAGASQPNSMYSPWAAFPDSPTPPSEQHFPPPNIRKYNALPGSQMRASGMERNEHLAEYETWSPEGSPARSPEFNYDRRSYNSNSSGSGGGGSRRDFSRNYRHSDLPRHHRSSSSSSTSSGRNRSGDRRWRDRDRDRDRNHHRRH